MKVDKEYWGDLENMIADEMDELGYNCFDEQSIRQYWEEEKKLYDHPVVRIQYAALG